MCPSVAQANMTHGVSLRYGFPRFTHKPSVLSSLTFYLDVRLAPARLLLDGTRNLWLVPICHLVPLCLDMPQGRLFSDMTQFHSEAGVLV